MQKNTFTIVHELARPIYVAFANVYTGKCYKLFRKSLEASHLSFRGAIQVAFIAAQLHILTTCALPQLLIDSLIRCHVVVLAVADAATMLPVLVTFLPDLRVCQRSSKPRHAFQDGHTALRTKKSKHTRIYARLLVLAKFGRHIWKICDSLAKTFSMVDPHIAIVKSDAKIDRCWMVDVYIALM